MIEVQITRVHPDAKEPFYAYTGDAGLDLHVLEDTWIPPGQGVDVRSGVAVAIPDGFYGRIVGRSSSLRKRGLLVSEGVIDSGFRGELFVYARNIGNLEAVQLRQGDSIGQLIVSPVPNVELRWVTDLPQSERGENGFGSSGR